MIRMVTGSDHRDGTLSELRLWGSTDGTEWKVLSALALVSPSFVAAHPSLPVIYAVSEQQNGTVSSIEIADSAAMSVTSTETSNGSDPCHLAINRDGTRLGVANYESGSVSVFALDSAGRISAAISTTQLHAQGPRGERQGSSHAHHVDLAHNELVVTDLGGDSIDRFSLAGDRIDSLALPAGFGPRHWLRVDGRLLVVGELAAELGSFDELEDGWGWTGSMPTTRGLVDAQPSGIAASDGWVFVANRGADTILKVCPGGDPPSTWRWAEAPCGGRGPRDIAFVAGKLAVANQGSSRVSFLDGRSLAEQGSLEHDSVACVLELPAF